MTAGTHSPEHDSPSQRADQRRLFAGLRTVSLWTLASRVLGMVRDMGMAAIFGGGTVMDAFSVAFRIPNLARRMFGEGALTAAFLPEFIRVKNESGETAAWQLGSAVLGWLCVTLGVVVLLGEIVLSVAYQFFPLTADNQLLVGLTAILLPYLLLICVAAQVCAMLHALGHFTWPAFLPVILNVIWLAGIWFVAPHFHTAPDQAYAVAVCVVFAGLLQLLAPLPKLQRLGFRYQRDWARARQHVAKIIGVMLPVMLGLSITQLNDIADSFIAWGLAQPEHTTTGGRFEYPLEVGTASALYFGQRLYQFPLGVFGIALGTVLFPQLSRHAAEGRLDRLQSDLMLGLRLVVVVGVPASVGLILLAEPLTRLLFQYGEFDALDVRRTTGMISAYGAGVWAYCGLLIINRGYYALGDQQMPLRLGVAAVSLNLVLSLSLIWFVGGPGLALGTAIASMFQVATAVWFMQRHLGRFRGTGLITTTLRTVVATGLMAGACQLISHQMTSGDSIPQRLLAVVGPFTAAVVVYAVAARILGLEELRLLFGSRATDPDDAAESKVRSSDT